MCGISRCWLDSKIIAQVCLRLATIKGHSKMCSFTVLGGSKNQSVSGVTTICLTQCNTSPSHRVDQVCWLWPVECWSTPLQWLCEVTGYQIKSNHFYCHITTAHVPWWVKFLRACSRNNLHIDSTYLQTYTDDNVQNTHTYTHYTQCTIRHTVIKTHYTLCVHILHYVPIYTHNWGPLV